MIMEQTPVSELFSLTIDPVTKVHLSETGRWAKFLAIIGFVLLGLVLIYNVFFFFSLASKTNTAASGYGGSIDIIESLGAGFLVINLLTVVVLFFPLLFLLRFANGSKAALAGNDQKALNLSFQNLKAFFRYWGIVTIIALALFCLMFVLTIIGTVVLS